MCVCYVSMVRVIPHKVCQQSELCPSAGSHSGTVTDSNLLRQDSVSLGSVVPSPLKDCSLHITN